MQRFFFTPTSNSQFSIPKQYFLPPSVIALHKSDVRLQ